MAESPDSPLTPREQVVLELVRRRWSNAEIAAELVVSVRTVETLYGTYAQGKRRRDDPVQVADAAWHVDLARLGWETDNEMFRETFARQFVPDAGREETDWFSERLRTTTTPKEAPLLEAAFHSLDVTEDPVAVADVVGGRAGEGGG